MGSIIPPSSPSLTISDLINAQIIILIVIIIIKIIIIIFVINSNRQTQYDYSVQLFN